jgi:hypothetical protein
LDLHASHASVGSFSRGAFGGYLSGKWGAFARSFKSNGSCARPGNDIPLRIGNRYNCIVERRMDVHNPFRNSLSDFLFPGRCALTRFWHTSLSSVSLTSVWGPAFSQPLCDEDLYEFANLYASFALAREDFACAEVLGKIRYRCDV